jgi:hypothetical protein
VRETVGTNEWAAEMTQAGKTSLERGGRGGIVQ